jgi:putative membrane protein
MDYMFGNGFLGTRAPFFMDFVTLIVTLLPLLMYSAIKLAQVKNYSMHKLAQTALFFVSFTIVSYFEYGVRMVGGFNTFMEGSHVSHNYALWVLIIHIIIATLTLIIWGVTLFIAWRGKTHKRQGIRTLICVTLTSLTGLWVYLLLFVY